MEALGISDFPKRKAEDNLIREPDMIPLKKGIGS